MIASGVGKDAACRHLPTFRTTPAESLCPEPTKPSNTLNTPPTPGGHGHEPAHGKPPGPGKLIGLTMALIGVLIAFCAALVGSERNELTRTMIEQTQAHSDYSSASTKFRLVMLDLEGQRAAPAAPGEDRPVLRRLLRLYSDYSKERKYSKEWSDSYTPLVQAHFEGAEGYEHAQLIAEIGIVLASLGVLLGSRSAWMVSIVLAVVCVVQIGRTALATHHEVAEAAEHVHHGERAYQDLRKAHTGANEDEKTVEALDPSGKLRAENEASAPGTGQEHAAHSEEHSGH